jgi:hypothetical protein
LDTSKISTQAGVGNEKCQSPKFIPRLYPILEAADFMMSFVDRHWFLR